MKKWVARNDCSFKNLTFGSNKKVIWSDTCGHTWIRSVKNQLRYKNCPRCTAKITSEKTAVTKAKHNGLFKNFYPELFEELISTEGQDKHHISKNSQHKALWKCSKCSYEWKSYVWERAKGRNNCPRCSNKILIVGENDLATVNPAFAKEIHPDNNISGAEIPYTSKKPVKWLCEKCKHIWIKTPYARISKPLCPQCYRKDKVSRGQKELFDFVSSMYDNTIMNAYGLVDSQAEIDIYVPEKRMGIEFNGDFWHSNRVTIPRLGLTAEENHLKKLSACKASGIELLFVWESDWIKNPEEVKREVINALEYGTISPILRKLESADKASRGEAISLVSLASGPELRPRKILASDEKKIKEMYLCGKSKFHIAKELNVSISAVNFLVKENNLASRREELGFSKNGHRQISSENVEKFKHDLITLPQYKVMEKWGIGYKMFHKMKRLHGETNVV